MDAGGAIMVLLALLFPCLAAPATPSFFIPAGTTILEIGPGNVVIASHQSSSGLVLSSPGGGNTFALPPLHPVFTPTNPSKVTYVSATQPGVASIVLALAPPDTQTLLAGAVHPERPQMTQVPPGNTPGPSEVISIQYGLPNL